MSITACIDNELSDGALTDGCVADGNASISGYFGNVMRRNKIGALHTDELFTTGRFDSVDSPLTKAKNKNRRKHGIKSPEQRPNPLSGPVPPPLGTGKMLEILLQECVHTVVARLILRGCTQPRVVLAAVEMLFLTFLTVDWTPQ